ncbi:MAG: hypothetical protein PHW33_01160 [Candidatus Portnoybacteria bacterium]|nr:hypothetical protein [Candidatus Portnoybacteria bacterium]
MARQPCPRYNKIAARLGVDPNELKACFHCLDDDDVSVLCRRSKPKRIGPNAITDVINAITRYNRFLTRKRLYFFWANDHSVDAEDVEAELACQAVRIIRHYEIFDYDADTLAALVARGLKNYAANLAKHHGHEARNPLLSLETREKRKTVWYLNVRQEKVEEAYVLPDDIEHRHDTKILTYFADRTRYANVYRFYPTQQEAAQALRDYRAGILTPRTTIMDLTPATVGDWIPRTRSFDIPNPETGLTLHDIIPAPQAPPEIQFDRHHNVIDSKTKQFIETINGDWEPLFDAHCVKTTGLHSDELPVKTLVCAARTFVGIGRNELRENLATVLQ